MARRPLPLTKDELQELNRTVKSETGRRLLWEIHRIRAILLRAHELEILLRDDRLLGRDVQLVKMANALRADLDKEPFIEEERQKDAWKHLRRHGGNL